MSFDHHTNRNTPRARLAALALTSAILASAVLASASAHATSFVRTSGTRFTIDGREFFVAGVNNHYLTFGSQAEVLRVLDAAAAMGANTIRTFLQPVIGSPDGGTSTIWDAQSTADASDLGTKGAYMIYWDRKRGEMAFNDGPDGMGKVDFLIAEAAKRHLKLVIAFLDFWPYTGGAQQMRAWYGSSDEATFFFRDPRTRRDYERWVEHVVRRINPLTGLAYRDDPTIMAWELMNEGNAQPASLRLSWTSDMVAYVKSVDPNHLVGSGNGGVDDRMADMSVPGVDFGTFHGYPLYQKISVDRFDALISDYCAAARERGKPVLMEEFGYARSNEGYVAAYRKWLGTTTRDPDCAGWLVWRLVSTQDSGRYPLDAYDQFDVHDDGGPLWKVLKAAAEAGRQRNRDRGAGK
jgi:mannan endo-1,4-beta-mannosidase